MAYIGQGIKQGTFKVLDTSGNTYNGSNTTFNLGTQVGSAAQLLVSHDGVIQKAGTDYTLATGGTQITFSTAPASGASIFITEISGAVGGTVTPSDTSVTADKLNSALLTGHTDIGANIADADLFLTDDGAGGTLRKTAASRLKTYVGAGAGAFDIANLDIDGGTDIGVNWRWMQQNDVKPQLLVCFTDGETWDQWGDADYCDTLWVIHTNDKVRPPFGQTVYYG